MESSSRNKAKVIGAVLAIFVLGFTAGALSWKLYAGYRPGRSARQFDGRRGLDQMLLSRLNLTEEQKTQVEKIIDETRAQIIELRKQSEPRMQEVRRQTDERLQAVLTPEQWEQFKQLREQFPRRRGMRGGPPGDR